MALAEAGRDQCRMSVVERNRRAAGREPIEAFPEAEEHAEEADAIQDPDAPTQRLSSGRNSLWLRLERPADDLAAGSSGRWAAGGPGLGSCNC